MSKLPSYRRLMEQDYKPEEQDLVRQLSVSINYGIEAVYELLNGKLTFRDNFNSTIKQLDVEVDSTGKPKVKTIIKKSGTDKIEGLWVINATNQTKSSVYPSSGVLISYTETADSIIIDNIAGLSAGYIWRIKVIAIV